MAARCPSQRIHNFDQSPLPLACSDWNQPPPDNSLGLWREVELQILGGHVQLSDPGVDVVLPPVQLGSEGRLTALPQPATADVIVTVQVRNWDATAAAAGTLRGNITDDAGTVVANFSAAITLGPGEDRTVTLTYGPAQPGLRVANPRLWWPAQMGGGRPSMHTLAAQFDMGMAAAAAPASSSSSGGSGTSDVLQAGVGLRHLDAPLDAGTALRRITVNGVPLQVRGGGWSPDLFLRPDADRLAAQIAMTGDMGLNAIRLEGKMEPDAFFQAADEAGILTLPGW